MLTNLLNEVLGVEIPKNFSGYGSVDLELIGNNGLSESCESWCFLDNSLVCFLIEENGVVDLFLYLNLSPTLLLCFASSGLLATSTS